MRQTEPGSVLGTSGGLAGGLHSSPALDAVQMRGPGLRKDRSLFQTRTLDSGCAGLCSPA